VGGIIAVFGGVQNVRQGIASAMNSFKTLALGKLFKGSKWEDRQHEEIDT
jgi:hypothetical protein